MSLGDCAECLKLHQDVTIAATRHMAAMSQHAIAVRDSVDEAEIAELEDAMHQRGIERREAFDHYRIHLLKHTMKVSGAGAGQV